MTDSLLVLHPLPNLKRIDSYLGAAEILSAKYEVKTVFSHTSDIAVSSKNIFVESFTDWHEKNGDLISGTSIQEIEARYLQSNLWTSVVAERRFTDYSFLSGGYPTLNLTKNELERFLVAAVLYYEEIIEKHDVRVIFAGHTDNVHSALIFEMALSRDYESFLIFPDYYWEDGSYFIFDSKFFCSRRQKSLYKKYFQDYELYVKPNEVEIENFLSQRNNSDPKVVATHLFKDSGFISAVKDSVAALVSTRDNIWWFRKPVVRGYSGIFLLANLRAWLLKRWNEVRFFSARSVFSAELPKTPFVYLPLQRVPEAAMLSRAPAYLNQLALVQVASAALPAGYTLVVKDHPRSKSVQSISFYKGMARLPNVVVMESSFDNHRLIEGSSVVLTIAGTLGFQKLMRGGRVLMLGRKFYEDIEGATQLHDPSRLPSVMKKLLFSPPTESELKKERRSLFAFINVLLETRISLGVNNKELHRSPESLAQLLATALHLDFGWRD